MKLYKMTFNQNSYDQYDAFIVRAKDENHVVEIIKEKYPEEKYPLVNWESGYDVEPLEGDEAKIILGSYNAG